MTLRCNACTKEPVFCFSAFCIEDYYHDLDLRKKALSQLFSTKYVLEISPKEEKNFPNKINLALCNLFK
jgi:hypothetical protein